jgi:hypothetical protein
LADWLLATHSATRLLLAGLCRNRDGLGVEKDMDNVTKFRLPLRKRMLAWFKCSREERLGWMAVAMMFIAIAQEISGHTDRGTFTLCLAMFLLLISKQGA